jgi:hypothetical protein
MLGPVTTAGVTPAAGAGAILTPSLRSWLDSRLLALATPGTSAVRLASSAKNLAFGSPTSIRRRNTNIAGARPGLGKRSVAQCARPSSGRARPRGLARGQHGVSSSRRDPAIGKQATPDRGTSCARSVDRMDQSCLRCPRRTLRSLPIDHASMAPPPTRLKSTTGFGVWWKDSVSTHPRRPAADRRRRLQES